MAGKKRGSLGKLIVSWIIILLGAFYALLPHSVHVRYGIDWLAGLNFSHSIHIVSGIVLLVIGIIVLRRK